jgi:hypothetical protein
MLVAAHDLACCTRPCTHATVLDRCRSSASTCRLPAHTAPANAAMRWACQVACASQPTGGSHGRLPAGATALVQLVALGLVMASQLMQMQELTGGVSGLGVPERRRAETRRSASATAGHFAAPAASAPSPARGVAANSRSTKRAVAGFSERRVESPVTLGERVDCWACLTLSMGSCNASRGAGCLSASLVGVEVWVASQLSMQPWYSHLELAL